jgi:hypothetical protein
VLRTKGHGADPKVVYVCIFFLLLNVAPHFVNGLEE